MKRLFRYVAGVAVCFACIDLQAQQQDFVGSPLDPNAAGGSGAVGAAALGAAAAAASGSAPSLSGQGLPGGATLQPQTITNMLNRLRTQQAVPASADAKRRVDEIEARQFNEQIDLLQGATERNDFQNFVLKSTGRDLPVFGTSLFRNAPSTFAPLDNFPATPDYVLGPGDEVRIYAWGQVSVDLMLVIDRSGMINVPRVGAIRLAGLRYEQMPQAVKAAFDKNFRNFELHATLGNLRSVQVYVVGQARRAGTYTVSAMSTLVNAIFAAGGPSAAGSMRSIQLKRGNKVVTEFDLYDLLISGDKSKDVPLLPGDVIQFTPVGPLVAMSGAVNTPAIYELKQGAPLFDVVRWSGGLSTTAQGQKVTVERIEDRKSRRVDEFPLDMAGLSRPLKDGDLVTVHSVTPRFDNAITLRGNVAQPGRFPWKEGMRIKDLIPDRMALLSREYWVNRNQLVGLDPDVSKILTQQGATGTNLSVEDLNQRRMPAELDRTFADTIRRMQTEKEAARFLDPMQTSNTVQSIRSQAPARTLSQETQDPARLDAAKREAQQLITQIRTSSAEVNWDYALIERIDPDELTTKLQPFNLAKALQGDSQHNLLLRPGDIVSVFSKADLQVPTSRKIKYVRLEGELNNAGVYQVEPGETLRQLVARVGGLSANAYLFGSVLTRESTRVEQQKSLDEALNRLEREIQRYNILRAQNVTAAEDAGTLKEQYDSQQRLISRLRMIKPTGRIVLELPEDASLKNIPDIALEDGDRFIVPAPPSMVSVMGSVYAESSFIYRPEKRVSDYLAQAGGLTKSADSSSVYVMRADGSVFSKQQHGGLFGNFESARLMPGDSIVVTDQFDRTTLLRGLRDFAQIFYQFGLGAAAIKVLRQ